MRKYNNQDQSKLSVTTSVENITRGIKSKDKIWSIYAEMQYHE